MNRKDGNWFRAPKWIGAGLIWAAMGWMALAQMVSTTTVQGTVYLANGQPGTGTLQVSWPAFTTANSQTVTAGRTTVTIGADGFLSVNLAPNLGSTPAGLFYTAVYHMSDGTTSTEYCVVPSAPQTSIAQVRSQVMPSAQAVQAVSKAYVDQAIQSIAQGSLTSTGGAWTGPLYLIGDPTQALQAADKHYVDTTFGQAVPLSGATMTGPLTSTQLGVVGSGSSAGVSTATIDNAGDARFSGTLQVGGTSAFAGSTTIRNQMDAEADAALWAGATASQNESLIYKDYTGASQWNLKKDAHNDWALNSATSGIDSVKAYQSSNGGDTYIDASNPSGTVRINYESGAGTGFNIYGGNSGALYASLTGANAIKFPGLAAGSGHNCVQIDDSGYITNTGFACGSGSGTVGSGTIGQIAYYGANGTAIGGLNAVPLTAGGTGALTAGAALANLGGLALTGGTMTGPLAFSTPSAAATTLSSILSGVTSDGNNGINVGGNIAALSTNSMINAAMQQGANAGAQIDNACAALGGSNGYVTIPQSMGAGWSTHAVPSNCHLIDLRGNSEMDWLDGVSGSTTVGLTHAQFMRGFESAPANPSTYQGMGVLHVHMDAAKGGVNSCCGGGTANNKTDYYPLILTSADRTVGQRWSLQSILACYGSGDCIGHNNSVVQYGGYDTQGDEQTEGSSIWVSQETLLFTGSVQSINGNVITYKTSTNDNTLGEHRLLIDTATVNTTGSISGISGTTITGVGTAWQSQFGANGPFVICFDWLANSGLKFCVSAQVVSNTSATITSLKFTGVDATAWQSIWGSTGTFHAYRGSLATQVDLFAKTITVADGTQFNTSSTLEQEIAYNSNLVGIRLAMDSEMGTPNGGAAAGAGGNQGGIAILDTSSATAPGYGYGTRVYGKFATVLDIGASNGQPQDFIRSNVDPGGGGYVFDLNGPTTGTLSLMRYNSAAGARTWTYDHVNDILNIHGFKISGTGHFATNTAPQSGTLGYLYYSDPTMNGINIAGPSPNSGTFPFFVGMGSGVPAFYIKGIGSGQVEAAVNNGQAMNFYSGNQSGTTASINAASGKGTFNGGAQIGASGTTISAEYKGTGTLTYASITSPGCQEQPLTITGAAAGDMCSASTGASDVGTGYFYGGCRVSAANTAQIKVCATSTGTPAAVAWTGWARH